MQIDRILSEAWSLTEKADIPEVLQPYAFREAVRLLAPSASGARQATRTGGGAGASAKPTPDGDDSSETIAVSEDEILDRVASQTGADRALLERVVHLDDDGLRLSIPGVKLGRTNAEATRNIAAILTIVRDFGLGEKETPIELVRKETDRLRVYDSGNFSTYFNSVGGFQVVGSGQTRRLRAKSPGISAFAGLVEKLAEDL